MSEEPVGGVAATSPDLRDINHARQFLEALDSTAKQWVFQTFDDSQEKRGHLVRVLHGSLDHHLNELLRLNATGAGIFLTINEVEPRRRRRAENIRRVRALFIDSDDPTRAPELRSKIDQYGKKPSIVVESSPQKYHVYWVVNDCPLECFAPAQKRLIEIFGSDSSVCDLPRVMRLPGFIHQKGTPFRSRIVTL